VTGIKNIFVDAALRLNIRHEQGIQKEHYQQGHHDEERGAPGSAEEGADGGEWRNDQNGRQDVLPRVLVSSLKL
jgi:hypothetical protein